jgi:hypothetical protein
MPSDSAAVFQRLRGRDRFLEEKLEVTLSPAQVGVGMQARYIRSTAVEAQVA